jgi:hypothetical protein
MKNVQNKTMASRMTAHEVKNDSQREYNPSEWERAVDRFSKYSDVEFYKVDKGNGYDYDRFFVVYTLEEGLRLLGSLSYGGSLTNGGFYSAFVRTFNDEFEMYLEGKIQLQSTMLNFQIDGEVKPSMVGTSKEARAFMIERSKKFGMIWTKESL